MQQPQRASRLRLVALASTVALAVALPLTVATAGQDAPSPVPVGDDGHRQGQRSGQDRGQGPGQHAETGPETAPAEPGAGPDERGGKLSRRLADAREPDSACGPEVTSPEGVEAQTCVLTQGDAAWARTYYRNITRGQLTAVLTLLRPDGRATRVRCAMPAAGEPSLCETPRVAAAEGRRATAVAEVASTDGERLLLRAGSGNSRARSRT